MSITKVIPAMKTAISIPDDVFDAAEDLAERLSMSRSELYSRAVAEFIRRRRGEGVTELLNEVYGDRSSRLDPVLASFQFASLSDDEEW